MVLQVNGLGSKVKASSVVIAHVVDCSPTNTIFPFDGPFGFVVGGPTLPEPLP